MANDNFTPLYSTSGQPQLSVREELAQRLKASSSTPSVSQMFNNYVNAKRDGDDKPADSDPEDKRIAQGLESSSQAMREIAHAKALADKAEADRHKVDPKRQRWSSIASAATDAITGIAGMIGVSNGSKAFDVTSSSGKTHDTYDKEHQLRKEALDKYYKDAYSAYKQDYDNLMALRKRRLEEKKRAYEERQQSQKESLYPYHLATAQSNAEAARYRASAAQTAADYAPRQQQAKLNNTNARTNATNRRSSSSAKDNGNGKKKSARNALS